jgi:hypothetical protein
MFFAGLLYLLTLPVAVVAIRLVNKKSLVDTSQYRANKITILLHSISTVALVAGFIVYGLKM